MSKAEINTLGSAVQPDLYLISMIILSFFKKKRKKEKKTSRANNLYQGTQSWIPPSRVRNSSQRTAYDTTHIYVC